MATRKVKDAIDLTTEEKIYFRGHAKATYMSDGRNVEDAINQIGTGGGGGGITAETDPIFSASAAASITEEKKAEWDNKMDKVTLATVATTGSYNDLIDKPASTQYFGPVLEGVPQEDIVWNQDAGKATIDLGETGFTHIVYPTLTHTYDVFYKVASLEELRANPQLYLGVNAKGGYGSVHYSESEGIATLTLSGTPLIYNYPWKAVCFNNGVVTLPDVFIPESVVKKSDLGEYVKHTELGDFEAEVVDPKLAQKQDKLVSGTNIKTINGESILGSGDIEIGSSVTENQLLWTKVEGEAGVHLKGTNGTATGNLAISAGDDKTASDGTVFKSTASGDHAVVFGYGNTCAGRSTLAQGLYNTVSGKDSVAFGQRNTVNGDQAFAAGQQNEVTTRLGVAIGYKNKATNTDSIAIGYQNTSSGSASVAMGDSCEASGTSSTAMGYKTKATGAYSSTFGENTQATNEGEVAMGVYNKSTTSTDASKQTLFSFGIGTSDTDRANAFEIKKNGDVYVGETLLNDISGKQDKLVSGTNIKTINGQSIVGSGDLQIEGGGGNGLANYPIEYPFTDGVVELVPNTYYMVEPQLGQTEIAFSLAEPTDNTIVNEYVVQIDNKYMIGDVMISFPSNITWKNGDIPTLKEGKILVISIVESLAVYAEF